MPYTEGQYQNPDSFFGGVGESLSWWWETIKLPYTYFSTPSVEAFGTPSVTGNAPSVPEGALTYPYQPTQVQTLQGEIERMAGWGSNRIPVPTEPKKEGGSNWIMLGLVGLGLVLVIRK